jgi:putative phosphoribosyl transferase
MDMEIRSGELALPGTLEIPANARGLVIFAHGSGSSRLSPRNRWVARRLNEAGLATLLFDLLTTEESRDRALVFDIPLLSRRLALATRWAEKHPQAGHLPMGYFGASTGSAAALWAASEFGTLIRAVVSRGGRPDLALHRLKNVQSPTLLIVGGADEEVIELNEKAHELLPDSELLVIPGATHLFSEPGTLEEVADQARDWFIAHLGREPMKSAG